MRILLCGDSSFAAQGAAEVLEVANHEVVRFGRGPVAAAGSRVTGPVAEIDSNPYLTGHFDAVINYILLKDDGIEPNVQFIHALLRLCQKLNVPHLVHFSSVSSYPSGVSLITESTPIEKKPLKKGPYGSLKVATDQILLEKCPKSLRLTLLRPGFILGPGLMDPIVGTAFRLPWNKLVLIGSAQSIIPVTTRDKVHEVVVKVLENPVAESPQIVLILSPVSPTRQEFLNECCHSFGCGQGVLTLPGAVWYLAAICGGMAAALIGQKKLGVYNKLSSRAGTQRFDPTGTQRLLNCSLEVNWQTALRDSLSGQTLNFQLTSPFVPAAGALADAAAINILGYGRIVRQKHRPALAKLGFTGRIEAFDLRAGIAPDGQKIQALPETQPGPAALTIVATPGPLHTEAIEKLANVRGPILIEKPLCYQSQDLDRWLAFAAARSDPVTVCHNYRYKSNVQDMHTFLGKWNPGRLHAVSVQFSSPPVANDSVAWLRQERRAATLLLDYSIHLLDVAMAFGRGPWQLGSVHHSLDQRGHTALIVGTAATSDFTVNFELRQGFAPRRAKIIFSFQNYFVHLGFFPDTFAVYMAGDNRWTYAREGNASWRATRSKIFDKLTGRDSDLSHCRMIAAALGSPASLPTGLQIADLTSFYRLLFDLRQRVYG